MQNSLMKITTSVRNRKNILMKIDEMVKANPHITNDRVLVIDGEGWHQGVIGIVAAKVKEFSVSLLLLFPVTEKRQRARAEVLRDFPFVMRFCLLGFTYTLRRSPYGGRTFTKKQKY